MCSVVTGLGRTIEEWRGQIDALDRMMNRKMDDLGDAVAR